MNGGDLVFHREGGKIMAGGYPINSFFLKNGIPASINLNRSNNSSNVSDLFNSNGIPAPLLYNYHECKATSHLNQEDVACISEELYSNILSSANVNAKNKIKIIQSKNYTQRRNKKASNYTEKIRDPKEYNIQDQEEKKKKFSKRKKEAKRVFTKKH